MKRLMNCSLFATTAFAVALSLSAHATLLEFDLNANFGDTDAGGDVQIQITEAATSGDVHVTVVNNTLGFVDNLYLNYSPVADIANAVIYNFDDGSGTVAQPAVQYNALQGFSILFGYSTANNANRFNAGESVSFDLSAAGSLLVSGFNTLGGGPAGDDYYAAATVNAVAEHGTCSVTGAKLGDANGGNVSGGGLSYTCAVDPALRSVPEPAPLVLLGAAALASVPATRRLASVRRRLALVHG